MKTLSYFLATLWLTASAAAAGSAEPNIYIGSIEPLQQAPSGSGPLHHLASRPHNRKVNQNAATLSKDIARALSSQNAPAVVLSTDAPLPMEGWLVRGVYYANDNGRLISVPVPGSAEGSNVEVTITVADCAKDPNAPFAVIGTEAAVKGQDIPAGWKPYVIAAKFVVDKAQGQHALDALADQIATKILELQKAKADQGK
jgi:hypothetical protein